MDSRQRSCVMSCENSCEVAWLGYCRQINKEICRVYRQQKQRSINRLHRKLKNICLYSRYNSSNYSRLCCVVYKTMLCGIQDYTRVSAGLCDMIYNTTLYGIQYQLLCYVVPEVYQKQYQKHDTTYRVSLLLCINNSILHRDISAYAVAQPYN